MQCANMVVLDDYGTVMDDNSTDLQYTDLLVNSFINSSVQSSLGEISGDEDVILRNLYTLAGALSICLTC